MTRLAAGWLLGLLLIPYASAQVFPSTVKLALGENKPPYTFSNPPGGIEYDLLRLVIERMGSKPDIILVPNARARALLNEGKIDGAIGVSGEFASQPYITYQNAAISLKSRALTITRVADLTNYRVIAFQNARLFLGPEFAAMADANPNYKEVAPQVVANQLLFSGRADVVISDVHIFDWLNRQADMVDVTQPISVHRLFPATRYRILFRDPILRDAFDDALKSVLEENPFPMLVKRYLPNPIGADFKP
jgi:polar amino acid transport system substrate-binding protein